MTMHGPLMKAVAVVLIFALQGLLLPARAETEAASLTGSLLSATDETPLRGAKLYAGDPRTGEVYTSTVSSEDGSFVLSDLPPGTYELAVETGGGLYMISTPVQLEAGQSQQIHVSVNPVRETPGAGMPAAQVSGKDGVWSNPLTAALIVLGAALIVGYAVNKWTDDDPAQGPPVGSASLPSN